MKKLAANTFGLLLVIGLSIFGLEFLYKDHINPIDYNLKPLQIVSNNVETLILGASHTQALGNQPIFKNQNCYNASNGGQDLFHSYLVLKSFIDNMNKLKTVIIELEYHSLGYNFNKFNQEWKDRQYYTYTKELYNKNWLNQLLAKSNFFRSNRDLSYILNLLSQTKQVPINTQEAIIFSKVNKLEKKNNFIPLANKRFNFDDCKKRALEQAAIKYNKSLIPQNKNVLEKLIKLCRSKNINLIFLNTPKTSCYIDNYLSVKEMREMKNEISMILKKNRLKHYDFFNHDSFNDNDFSDYDHINNIGAIKLRNLICEYSSF